MTVTGTDLCIQSTSPLTPKGEQQATLLGKYWKELKVSSPVRHTFDHVFVSPTTRTRATASIICKNIGKDETTAQLSDSLLELTHGEWDGKPREVYHTPEVIEQMIQQGWDWKSPAGGESLRDVEKRMATFINEQILPLSGTLAKPTTILTVSHSIAIRTLLKTLLNCDENLVRRHGLENTGVSEFWKYPEGWSLQRWNDHSHLRPLD